MRGPGDHGVPLGDGIDFGLPTLPKNGEELDEAMTALDRGPMSADELAWMKRVGVAVRDGAKREMRGMGMGLLDKLFAS